MTLPKVLWTAFTGSVMAVVWLFSSWMHSVDARADRAEERQIVSESHYSAIEQHLLDMSEDIRDIKKELKPGVGR